jgi:hypothetical protein
MKIVVVALALLACTAQAGTLLTSQVVAGGFNYNEFSNTGVFALDCGSFASCVASDFTGATMNLAASYADGANTFSASGLAGAPDRGTLRASAALTLTGSAFVGDNQRWFVNAVAGMQTDDLVLHAPTPAESGLPAELVLRYRFEGTVVDSPAGDVATLATATVRAASGPAAQFLPCTTDPTDARFCLTQALPVHYDEVVPFEVWLDATVRVTVAADSGTAHAATLNVDYADTLQFDSAQVTGAKGQPLRGWTLTQDSTVLAANPVPEPAGWMLMAGGLVAIGTVAARRPRG